MTDSLSEILLILLLVLLNGVFAMSEMAIVSARKARLQHQANRGNRKARVALELALAPDRILSTVQVGITLVGILAGAIGGVTLSDNMGAWLAGIPFLAPWSDVLGMVLVVMGITYLSLVLGELVPKRIALNHPEWIACRVAGPMKAVSLLAWPLVRLLELSTRAVLFVIRTPQGNDPPVTEEEIQVILEQATHHGVLNPVEHAMVTNVFRLEDQHVGSLLTPRHAVTWLDTNLPLAALQQQVREFRFTMYPVCRGRLDDALGFVEARDLLVLDPDTPPDWNRLVVEPLLIPETLPALDVLETFRRRRARIALVIDEYGAVEGLVSLSDLLEAIVGDPPSARGDTDRDGVTTGNTWLLEGSTLLDEIQDRLPRGSFPDSERGQYHTLAGFVLARLGHIPAEGESFSWRGTRFVVLRMHGIRIGQVQVSPPPAGEPGEVS